MHPKEFRYTKDHEWAKAEGSRARVGITDHAQSELGDIVYVELPAVGREVKQGEGFATVESVKAVSDVYAPVSGKVVEVNERLSDEPELINKSPHDQGWLALIEMADPKELERLMTAEEYERFLEKGEE
ncbi:MAG: glycine cleavage system protein GcvH [Candidatus Acetothermia bacterium]|jgi:glycine cleavage system H protein|nr:glycine cleavage system protein GcvH [Candidatus Acetothermia bacterium]MDH7505121.1 glycine cleavage system protein GcvH [Candidatus Acetothermia bacterium]